MINITPLILILLVSCTESKKSTLSKYAFNSPMQINISKKLNEISALETSDDDKIFGINDEDGIIYTIEPKNGKIIKRFSLGINWTVEADFEGLAIAEKEFYAITSNGKLYSFNEGKHSSSINYNVQQLLFTSKFNIEGLYYDKKLDGLLILPKDYAGSTYNKFRAIYFYSFKTKTVNTKPIILISLKQLKKHFHIKDFYPSGITKHPVTGNYLIISAKGQNCIVEVDSLGIIIDAIQLNNKTHRQPEGITILNDLTLIISDEAAGKKASITKYNYNK